MSLVNWLNVSVRQCMTLPTTTSQPAEYIGLWISNKVAQPLLQSENIKYSEKIKGSTGQVMQTVIGYFFLYTFYAYCNSQHQCVWTLVSSSHCKCVFSSLDNQITSWAIPQIATVAWRLAFTKSHRWDYNTTHVC